MRGVHDGGQSREITQHFVVHGVRAEREVPGPPRGRDGPLGDEPLHDPRIARGRGVGRAEDSTRRSCQESEPTPRVPIPWESLRQAPRGGILLDLVRALILAQECRDGAPRVNTIRGKSGTAARIRAVCARSGRRTGQGPDLSNTCDERDVPRHGHRDRLVPAAHLRYPSRPTSPRRTPVGAAPEMAASPPPPHRSSIPPPCRWNAPSSSSSPTRCKYQSGSILKLRH